MGSHGSDGDMNYPRRRGRAGEEAFPGYLRQARAVLAALPGHIEDGPTWLSPEFEALRWSRCRLPACPPSQATRRAGADACCRESP